VLDLFEADRQTRDHEERRVACGGEALVDGAYLVAEQAAERVAGMTPMPTSG